MRNLALQHGRTIILCGAMAMICLSATPVAARTTVAWVQELSNHTTRSDTRMTMGHGTFQVKVSPRPVAPEGFAGMTLEKTYTGALEARASGEMLSGGNPSTGNAGYVAMERVTGKLDGHDGSFVMMQSGVMSTGAEPAMTATIVPGSGTGALSGIYGTMTLGMTGGEHRYTINYAISQ